MESARRWILLMGLVLLGCVEKPMGTKHWLIGDWKAEAFGGILSEKWRYSDDGTVMGKNAYYVEKDDTLYSEVARIDNLAGKAVLMARPFNAAPLIFEMTDSSPTRMVFENNRFENPFRIVYESVDTEHFTRTVTGVQNGDTVETVYRFEREP